LGLRRIGHDQQRSGLDRWLAHGAQSGHANHLRPRRDPQTVTPGQREKQVRSTAILDGPEVRVRIPQDPGGADKFEAYHFVSILEGYSVSIEPEQGSKERRAETTPLQPRLRAGDRFPAPGRHHHRAHSLVTGEGRFAASRICREPYRPHFHMERRMIAPRIKGRLRALWLPTFALVLSRSPAEAHLVTTGLGP